MTAEDVAEVIESTLRRPQAELWVPRYAKRLTRTMSLLPRRVQEVAAHAFRADTALSDADPAARAAYEERVRPRG